MRSLIFGAHIASNMPSLQSLDTEVFAIATILHDLGWAPITSPIISKDKRFEVDGANAARDFLTREGDPKEWDDRRLQLVWDAIALHSSASIAAYKEKEVQAAMFGITLDFRGPEKSPGGILTREIWDAAAKEFPRKGLREGVKEVMCGLCTEKPATTWDNFVGAFGVKFVDGYSLEGKGVVDIIMGTEE